MRNSTQKDIQGVTPLPSLAHLDVESGSRAGSQLTHLDQEAPFFFCETLIGWWRPVR
jgi:hypothetical protein